MTNIPLVARRKEKKVPVNLRMSIRLKKAMDAQADEARRSFTTEVEIACEEYLEKLGKWPPVESNGRHK